MNIHTFCPLRPSCWKARILSWCERWNNTFPKIPYSVKPVNMLAYMATGTWQVIHLRILRQGSYPGLYMQSCGPYMRKRVRVGKGDVTMEAEVGVIRERGS